MYGQCPASDSLWNRINFLSAASAEYKKPDEFKTQLKELLGYESAVKNCTSLADSSYALLLQRIGATYAKLNEFINAVSYTKQSVTYARQKAKNYRVDASLLVKDYHNLSVFYAALNKPREKVIAMDSCINAAITYNVPDYYYLYILTEKVKQLADVGDYDRRYYYAMLGESATGKVITTADSTDFLVIFLLAKAEVLIGRKKYEETQVILEKKLAECIKLGAVQHLGALYGYMAQIKMLQNDVLKATDYFTKAYTCQEKIGFGYGCMQALNNLAYSVYDRHMNQLSKALGIYRKALSYADKSDDPAEQVESLTILANIGNMFSRNGMFDSSQHYFRLAFNCLQHRFTEDSLINHPALILQYRNADYLFLLVIDKANAFLAQAKRTVNNKYTQDAIRIYKIADRLISLLRPEQTETASKLFWRKNTRNLYEAAIEACYLSGNKEDALYFMEKSRAVLLNDQLTEQRMLGEEDILQQTQLSRKIGRVEEQIDITSADKEQQQQLEQELILLKQQRDKIVNNIRSKNPFYYQSFIDTAFINIADVRKYILADKQALVELFTGDSAVYVMMITKEQMLLHKVDRKQLEEKVLAYKGFLSNPGVANAQFPLFVQTSHQLYQLLFPAKEPPPGRIIISPDVFYFPFEALINNTDKKPVYLLQNHAISYTYSSRFLLNNFNNSAHSQGMFIGMAPVHFSPSLGMAGLPGSNQSIHQLGNYFSSPQLAVANAASKRYFLDHFSQYNIVQLYTHATDNTANGEPVIYFADSALYLSELMPERKPATQLIVLSACQTGVGALQEGEGMFGFNRGFAALGIPCSIANLWSADNESSYRITELFYSYIQKGFPFDEALQKAKLQFISTAGKEKQLPYYWAAAVVSGKTGMLEPIQKQTWPGLIWSAIIVLLAAGNIIFIATRYKT